MVNMKKELKKRASEILFSFLLIWRIKPLYLCYLLIEIAMRTCVPLLLTVFPKLILESISRGKLEESIIMATVIVGAEFFLNSALILIEGRKDLCNDEITMAMKEKLAEKMIQIRLEDLEQNRIAKQYHEALKCMERGGIEGYLSLFMKCISAVCILVGLVYLFTAFEW